MLYHMNKTFQNTIFWTSVNIPLKHNSQASPTQNKLVFWCQMLAMHTCLLLLSGLAQEARQKDFEQEKLPSFANCISWSTGYSIPLLTPVIPASS